MNPAQAAPRRPQPSAKLSRYLVSEMVLPSLYAALAFGLVVLMTDLLGYAELIVNRGLGSAAVAQIAAYQLIPTLARTLPLAVLVGSLVGLGRLSADRELLALETIGFSPRQLARPGLFFASGATAISILMSVVISPAAQRGVRDQLIRLTQEKPGLALQAGLASRIGDWRIEARKVEADGAQLTNVLLYMPSLGETIFSQRGAILTDESEVKRIVLEDGLLLANGENRASLLRFDRMETTLPDLTPDRDVPVDIYATMPFTRLLEGARADEDPTAARRMSIDLDTRRSPGRSARRPGSPRRPPPGSARRPRFRARGPVGS